jgi:hypothetical protein
MPLLPKNVVIPTRAFELCTNVGREIISER